VYRGHRVDHGAPILWELCGIAARCGNWAESAATYRRPKWAVFLYQMDICNDRLFVAEDGRMQEHGSAPCPGTSGTQGMPHNYGFSAMNLLLVLNSYYYSF
jgi:hypothetical protein